MKKSRPPCYISLPALLTLLSAAIRPWRKLAVEHDYLSLISEYVYKIENIYDGNWAFTYTVDDKLEMETRTVRRDTSLPFLESETLLAINGMSALCRKAAKACGKTAQRASASSDKTIRNRPVEDEEEGNETRTVY